MGQKINVLRYKFTRVFKVHQAFVVVLAVLILLIIEVVHVSSLGNLGSDQEYLNLEAGKVKAVHFNEDAIKQIESLRDSNVTAPGTQLPTGRQNPFSE